VGSLTLPEARVVAVHLRLQGDRTLPRVADLPQFCGWLPTFALCALVGIWHGTMADMGDADLRGEDQPSRVTAMPRSTVRVQEAEAGPHAYLAKGIRHAHALGCGARVQECASRDRKGSLHGDYACAATENPFHFLSAWAWSHRGKPSTTGPTPHSRSSTGWRFRGGYGACAGACRRGGTLTLSRAIGLRSTDQARRPRCAIFVQVMRDR